MQRTLPLFRPRAIIMFVDIQHTCEAGRSVVWTVCVTQKEIRRIRHDESIDIHGESQHLLHSDRVPPVAVGSVMKLTCAEKAISEFQQVKTKWIRSSAATVRRKVTQYFFIFHFYFFSFIWYNQLKVKFFIPIFCIYSFWTLKNLLTKFYNSCPHSFWVQWVINMFCIVYWCTVKEILL